MRTLVDSERDDGGFERDDQGSRHDARKPLLDLPASDPARYDLEREHGRGGLGCVFAARDRWLDREVALKRALDTDSRVVDARFVREALVASRLQHPGIVPVYDAGRFPDGEPFYAMKLVAGQTLREAIERAETLQARIALLPNVLAVVEAIAYAHDRRIIHRDLKPANVVLGDFGETVVIDWGIARDLDASDDIDRVPASAAQVALSGMTQTGAVLGTPGYMAPEQARGEEVDERADIYALGAMLYTLVRGRSPLHGLSAEDALARCLAGDIPRLAVPGAPPELETIVARAMAPRATDRYSTAKSLADDLRRFVTGQLVASHDYSAFALVKRFIGRHRAAVAVGAVLATALAITGVVSARSVLTERDRAQARENALILAQARGALERDPTESLAWIRRYPIGGKDWSSARQIAADAISLGTSEHVLQVDSAVNFLASFGDTVAVGADSGVHLVSLTSGRTISHLDVTPEQLGAADPASGTLLVTDSYGGVHISGPEPREIGKLKDQATALEHVGLGMFAAGDRTGSVSVWTRAGPSWVASPHEGAVVALASVGNGVVASLGVDGNIALSSKSQPPEVIAKLTAATGDLVGDGATRTLAIADGTEVSLWQAGVRRTLGAHEDVVTKLAFSRDGRFVASASADRTVRVWPVSGGGPPRVLVGHNAEVQHVVFSPTSDTLATADQSGALWLWPAGGGAQRLLGHRRTITDLAFSADGQRLASADTFGFVRTWPVAEGPRVLQGGSPALQVGFLSRGRVVATADDGAVRLWQPGGPDPQVLGRHEEESYALRVGSDGRFFASAGLDGGVKVWDSESGEQADFTHGDSAWDVAIAPDLHLIAAAGGKLNQVSLWDRNAGTHRLLEGHQRQTTVVQFAPDMFSLLSADRGGAVIVWALPEGTPRTITTHDGRAYDATFLRDGTMVASVGSEKGVLHLTDLATGKTRVAEGHTAAARTVAVSPDETLVATGSKDQTIRLWNAESGKLVRVLNGHEAEVRHVAFSPDGTLLASAGWDRVVRLWDVRTGASQALRGQSGDIQRVVFSADGKTLASTSRDGTVALWPVEPISLPVEPRALKQALKSMTSAVVGADEVVASPMEAE